MVDTWLLVIIVLVALAFDYTNGFHDAANAIATAVSTRALSPRIALGVAAVANFGGAFISQQVARTVGKGIISAPVGQAGLVLVLAALLGAIAWNLLTWWFGLPSSSSHALIGGIIGAALAAGTAVKWHGVKEKVLIPMVASPLLGFVIAFVAMIALLWLVHRAKPAPLNRTFRFLTAVSSGAMALGHGLQDAQKTMGVITLALITSGHLGKNADIPVWVIAAAAGALSLGTAAGGARIMRTLGRKVIQLDPARAFVAQTTASIVLFVAAHHKAPISTTHVITTSIMGAGATRKLSAVKWGVARNIIVAWVLTLPAAGLTAALFYVILKPILV